MNVVTKTVKEAWFPIVFTTLVGFGLLLYSFTQADLNLPISESFLIAVAENTIRSTGIFGSNFTFQHIGYFERPLSTNLYIGIVIGLCALYGLFLYRAYKNTINLRAVVVSIAIFVWFLFWSYPAFSYDIYNYMFDARILTKYQENPYLHKALDYPTDPWINVMRWTHRTYPYGPAWLFLTIPLSYIGFQDFGLTLFLFKLFMVGSYVGCCYFIYKILKTINPKWALFGTVFFAFNPLVIVESLVSAHNDIVMMFLAMWAYYLALQKKSIWALVLLLISIGIKFATVFLVPFFVLELFPKKFKHMPLETKITVGIGGMVVAVIAASIRTQFQPWYLLYIFPFAALIAKEKWAQVPVYFFSIAGLSIYIPYLYAGNWDQNLYIGFWIQPIPTILNHILAAACLLSILFLTYSVFKSKQR